MNYIGLDLSYTGTGFYLIGDDGKDVSFEIATEPSEFDTDISRSDAIASVIIREFGDRQVFIAMDDYFAGKQASSVIKFATLGTVVRLRLLEHGYSFVTFAPSQIKKFETGSGNAPKDTMLKSVFKKHGFDTPSNNIADACAMAYMGKAYSEWNAGKRDFLKYECEILKKVAAGRTVVTPYDLTSISEIPKTKRRNG